MFKSLIDIGVIFGKTFFETKDRRRKLMAFSDF